MANILISLEAISSILIECYRGNNNCETGGVLIGPKNQPGIITDILPSTGFAERSPATYYQSKEDVEILNIRLRQFQMQGYGFHGYFHKHPSGMHQLSHGDLRTCLEIFKSSNYRVNNHLNMCIVTEKHNEPFPVFSYVVSRSNTKITAKRTGISVLPKSCIMKCAECFGYDNYPKGGNNHAGNNVEQHTGGTAKHAGSDAVRSAGEGRSGDKLPASTKRTGKDGSVSSGQECKGWKKRAAGILKEAARIKLFSGSGGRNNTGC